MSGGQGMHKLDPARAPISTALGVMGMPGMTAYCGLIDIGKPQPGETVVVAAATGPVGATVGQIARIKGCRVVGIAGFPDKCKFLTDELGFDQGICHRDEDFEEQLESACPDGIDVYFENVGGRVLRESGDPHAESGSAGHRGHALQQVLRGHAGVQPEPGHVPDRAHPLPARHPPPPARSPAQ